MSDVKGQALKVHFIGIGGIGMSALARYFLAEGWEVSGSDIVSSAITDALKKEGVEMFIGHGQTLVNNRLTKIIYNQAISPNDPELKKAEWLDVPTQTYPEAIGELVKQHKTIAIAGSHGKSTTTSMVALILTEAGTDPTVIVGTNLKEFGPPAGGKNFRKGKSDLLVLEADEWKAALLNYFPAVSIITNIDGEHLDFYKTIGNVRKTFEQFKKQSRKVLKIKKDAKLAKQIRQILKIPGEHNVQNALAAYTVAKYLKVPKKVILSALAKFNGSWRRMEYKGTMDVELRTVNKEPKTKNKASRSKSQVQGSRFLIHGSKFVVRCPVYDDYGHHPTEIKATLSGIRQKWPKNPLFCVFQPHQLERLKLLYKDFKTSFKAADRVFLIPTYEVAGREKDSSKKAVELTKKLAKDIKATYVANPQKDLKPRLKKLVASHLSPATIVMMGAGNINDLTPQILEK